MESMEPNSGDAPGLITVDEARRFIVDCFLASNTKQEHAQAMADLLGKDTKNIHCFNSYLLRSFLISKT